MLLCCYTVMHLSIISLFAPVVDILQILKENPFMEIDIETDSDLDE